jgi:hypothetical protein
LNSRAEKIIKDVSICLINNMVLEQEATPNLLLFQKKIENTQAAISTTSSMTKIQMAEEIKMKYLGLQKMLFEIRESPDKNYSIAVKEANLLIESYLNYETCGAITSEVLAYFISAFCTIVPEVLLKNKRRLNDIVFALKKNAVSYIHNKVFELLNTERVKYNLKSYYELTYLAVLYGSVAMQLMEDIIDQSKDDKGNKYWAARHRALDELLVHEGFQTFVYPAAVVPYSVQARLEISGSFNGNIQYVYPQIKKEKIPSKEFEKVFTALDSCTQNKLPYDIFSSIYSRENAVINPNIKNDLSLIEAMYSV